MGQGRQKGKRTLNLSLRGWTKPSDTSVLFLMPQALESFTQEHCWLSSVGLSPSACAHPMQGRRLEHISSCAVPMGRDNPTRKRQEGRESALRRETDVSKETGKEVS